MYEIIVNPAGASGQTVELWKKAEPYFKNAGVDYHVHFSTKEEGIAGICRKLTNGSRDVDLVIVGGDGSLNDAVNGIVNFDRVRLGFIPCGSGNDLAKDIGLSGSLLKIVAKILEGKTVRTVDVGEVVFHNETDTVDYRTGTFDPTVYERERVRRFNISAGIGFDAECCLEVELSSFKKVLNKLHLGKLSYIVAAVKIIFGHRTCCLELHCDDQVSVFEKCLLAVVMNHRYEGGGFMFCPHAEIGDDFLDACVGDGLSSFGFFRIFPFAYSGRHLRFKGVHERRGHEFRLKTDHPVFVHTDGEVTCRSSDITVRLKTEKLKMIV